MRRIWSIFLVIMILAALLAEGARLDFTGFYKIEFNRIPNQGLIARDQLVIDSQVRSGAVSLYLKGFGVEGLWRSIHASPQALSLDIEQVYATAESSFLPGGTPLKFRFGTLALDYSPYFLKQDGSGVYLEETEDGLKDRIANPFWRGIHVAEVPLLGKLKADGFFFWENTNSNVGLGAQVRAPFTNLDLKGTYVTYMENPNFEKPSEQEQVYAVEFTGNLPFDSKVESTIAKQVKSMYGVEIDEAAMSIFTYSAQITPDVSGKIFYKSFEPNFDPRYRDRTPRFSYDGELMPGNPIDENKGQRGYGVEFDTELLGLNLGIGWEQYLEQRPGETISEVPTKELSYKLASNFLGIDLYAEYDRKLEELSLVDPLTGFKLSNFKNTNRVACELVKKSLPIASNKVDLGYRYYNLKVANEEFGMVKITNPYLSLERKTGLNIELGYKMYKIEQKEYPRFYVNFTGEPSTGVSWEIRYMSEAPPLEDIYDLAGKKYFDYGNAIRVNLAAYF